MLWQVAAPYERMAIKRACDKTFICFFTSSFLSLSSCQFHSLFLSPEIIRDQTQQCPSPCKRIADQQNFHLMMDLRKNHDPRKRACRFSAETIQSEKYSALPHTCPLQKKKSKTSLKETQVIRIGLNMLRVFSITTTPNSH